MTVNNSVCVIIALQESTMAAACCRDGGSAIKNWGQRITESRQALTLQVLLREN